MSTRVYHIATVAERDAYVANSRIAPASLEHEGFVHCSFADQLPFVLGTFFRNRADVVLLEMETVTVESLEVEWVPEANDAFPHVYAPIAWARVIREVPVVISLDGVAALPAELSQANLRRERRIAALSAAYPWTSHVEGMRFVETGRNASRTAGYYWFVRGSRSVFHSVNNGDELWLAHEGTLELFVIENGVLRVHHLGNNCEAGEVPQIVVPQGALQAARLAPHSDFAWGSNVCAPPFEYDAMTIPSRESLLERFPEHARLIEKLTHADL